MRKHLPCWSSTAGRGGDDIGQILKSVELRAIIKRILDKMAVLLPNTILVWTITDIQALEKVRMRIKLSIATYLTKYGVNIYVK